MPPETVTAAAPSFPPLQATFVVDVIAASSAGGSVMDSVVDAEQPFASVTLKVYVPAVLLNSPVPWYGGVPPVAVMMTVDVPPKQAIADLETDMLRTVGSVIVADTDAEQPLASVIVNEYVPAVLENDPVPLYGGVPPLAVTLTVEDPPLHAIGVAATEAVRSAGSVIVTEADAEHPLASVTLNEYVPAVLVNEPVPLYGGVPPLAVTLRVEAPPLHAIGVAVTDADSRAGSVIVTDVEAEHPFASVTVNEYVPAVLVNEPVPLYGGVPPEPLTVTVEDPPLHAIAVAFAETVRTVGSVMVRDAVAEHPLASVTVKEYDPADFENTPVPE